jgi:predicted Abi (CAAX) family protease
MRDLLWNRLVVSLTTPLTLYDVLVMVLLLLAAGVLILPVGLRSGFLRPEKAMPTVSSTVGIIAVTFIFPSLTEEILFRAFLLPHPLENVSLIGRWLWALSGLTAFVLYHPFKAPFVAPERAAIYLSPVFLWMVFVTGTSCIIAYLLSGSLWLPVAIHWTIVVTWLLGFGGYSLLHGNESNSSL